MSHSPKAPPLATTTADLPEVEDGVLAYDTTQGKPVARVAGAWSEIAGEVFGTPTVVYDDGTAVGDTDQIQGDIPEDWKYLDTSLKGVVIGTSCTSIGLSAFQGCTGLTGSLVIPNSVTRISSYAFDDCSNISSLVLSDNLLSIGATSFYLCSGLTGDLVIPDSVTSIGNQAFVYCSGLTGSLVIPNSVTSIGNVAFSNCTGFTSLTIGNSVTSIGSRAFSDCIGLTGTLTIPDSVTSIGGRAFQDCSGLTGSLVIPNSVTSIGIVAFNGCSSLTNVDCYVEKSVLDVTSSLLSSGVTTIHVRSTDSTWTAGAGQTIGGQSGITVIKDL